MNYKATEDLYTETVQDISLVEPDYTNSQEDNQDCPDCQDNQDEYVKIYDPEQRDSDILGEFQNLCEEIRLYTFEKYLPICENISPADFYDLLEG